MTHVLKKNMGIEIAWNPTPAFDVTKVPKQWDVPNVVYVTCT